MQPGVVIKGKQKFLLILVLGTLSAIGPFSIDMYLPAFPDIAAHLHSTVADVSLSLSSFFIGISAGQLLYGALLDRFGRKQPLYIGLSVYLLCSVACVFTTSVNMLIVLRFFQALGGCAGMVASRALVRDLFPVEENAKIFSLLMLVVGISPIIAPTAGGYITAALGWEYVFAVLALMGAFILVAVYFALPVGRKPDKAYSLKPGQIIKNYVEVIKQPRFIAYALTGAAASSGLYAYIAGSPYVFMQLYQVSEKQYGWIFALIAMGLIACSQVNSLLLRNYTSEEIIRVALLCQSLTGLLLVAGTITGFLELFSTIFFIFIFLCCQGFVFPNSSALSLAPFTRNAGSASGLLGALQLGVGTLTSAVSGALSKSSAVPMTAVMAACAISAFIVLLYGSRKITASQH